MMGVMANKSVVMAGVNIFEQLPCWGTASFLSKGQSGAWEDQCAADVTCRTASSGLGPSPHTEHASSSFVVGVAERPVERLFSSPRSRGGGGGGGGARWGWAVGIRKYEAHRKLRVSGDAGNREGQIPEKLWRRNGEGLTT